MMGTVIKSLQELCDQQKVMVRLSEDSIDYCKGCSGCSSLFKCKKNSTRIIIAKNPIQACDGDKVTLSLEDGATLKAMLYLIFIPLFIFLVTAFIGTYFNLSSFVIFLICISTCALFYCILKRVFRYKTYYVITTKSPNI